MMVSGEGERSHVMESEEVQVIFFELRPMGLQ